MVPDVGQRLLRALGNFAEQKPLEASQFDRFSLFLSQRCQPLLDDSPPFLKRQTSPRDTDGIGFRDLTFGNLLPVIEIPERKVLPAAQTSVVDVLENPRLQAALGRVELSRLLEDFKEDLLH